MQEKQITQNKDSTEGVAPPTIAEVNDYNGEPSKTISIQKLYDITQRIADSQFDDLTLF